MLSWQKLSVLPSDRSIQHQLDKYVRILSKLSRTVCLCTLVLTLAVPNRNRKPLLDSLDLGDIRYWTPLDEVLAQDHFSGLQTIMINFDTVDLGCYDLGVEFLTLFEKRLPMLYGRHILQSWNDYSANRKQGGPSQRSDINIYSCVDCHPVIRATIGNYMLNNGLWYVHAFAMFNEITYVWLLRTPVPPNAQAKYSAKGSSLAIPRLSNGR